MTTTEHELNNFILEQGWRAGAATPERVANLVERLSTKHKLRLAAIAIESTELSDDYADLDLIETAA